MTHVNADTIFTLKREFEKIVAQKQAILLANRSESKAWNDCYYCNPNSNQASTLRKRVMAMQKTQPEVVALLLPIVDAATLKGAEVQGAKDAHLKARNQKKADQAAKALDKEETKRNPYRDLHPAVADLMKQIAEPYRLKAIEMEAGRLNRILGDVKRLAGMFGSFDPQVIYPTAKGDAYGNRVQADNRMQAMMFLDVDRSDYHNQKFSLIAEPEKMIAAKAHRWAEDQVTRFVYRVGTKLSGIVEKKPLAKADITGSLMDHWMNFSFVDGAAFSVQSQIVWKTSVNGLHFAQFPTCFRNVKLSDGSKMELPSEVKMKENFV